MILSVIIPVYNGEMYLGDCLDSLMRQGSIMNDYEIIVVNDGSTDEETIEAVKKNIKEQIKGGDVMKGYKNLATANKIILDAREEMTKRLSNTGNKKNAKIALKFTNDNGEDIQLGVEIRDKI